MATESAGAAGGGVVMLAVPGAPTNIVYHALKGRLPLRKVVFEEPITRSELLKKRAKKLGWVAVGGQVLFAGAVVPMLRRLSRRRLAELERQFGFCEDPIPAEVTARVPSANSDEAIRLLKQLAPKVVLLSGTRIIAKRVLEQVPATFINMHAGITPRYRGVHGAYWALVESNRERCGVTVHVVDPGIDTGAVIDQATVAPGPEDCFVTYHHHQINAGLPLLERAIRDALDGRLQSRVPGGMESRLWSHPTIGQYLTNWLFRGVR